MTVIGTPEEINAALQFFRPDFPRQNLENAGKECCYVLDGVTIRIITVKEAENEKAYGLLHGRQNY